MCHQTILPIVSDQELDLADPNQEGMRDDTNYFG